MKKKRFSAEQIVATLKQAKLAAVYKISGECWARQCLTTGCEELVVCPNGRQGRIVRGRAGRTDAAARRFGGSDRRPRETAVGLGGAGR